MAEKSSEDTKKDTLDEFKELMQEVAELPADQQEKVTYFTQGVIAANTRRKQAENE
jgi:hypothetical protein